MKMTIKFFVIIVLIVTGLSGCCRTDKEIESEQVPAHESLQTSEYKIEESQAQDYKQDQVDPDIRLIERTGLGFSINEQKSQNLQSKSTGSQFERDYREAIAYVQEGRESEALAAFNLLLRNYSQPEKASIARLSIAQLHFRNQANELALQEYLEIVEKYPNTHAAQNARAGIEYLKNFERYKSEFISPDVEAKKRRGF